MTIQEKLQKIMGLAYEQSSDTYSVFVEYFPHVQLLNVRIYFDGWDTCDDYNYKISIDLCEDDALESLDMLIEDMENMYNTNKNKLSLLKGDNK